MDIEQTRKCVEQTQNLFKIKMITEMILELKHKNFKSKNNVNRESLKNFVTTSKPIHSYNF